MIYTLCKTMIQNGMTGGLQDKLDVFFATGRLNEGEYVELSGLMGGDADEAK